VAEKSVAVGVGAISPHLNAFSVVTALKFARVSVCWSAGSSLSSAVPVAMPDWRATSASEQSAPGARQSGPPAGEVLIAAPCARCPPGAPCTSAVAIPAVPTA
jgi:hypothetical protein